jgi:hypothetical protein
MKLRLRAVCDTHGEAINFFCSNPTCTSAYLSDYDVKIQEWMEKHIHCGLRIIGDGLQLDAMWEEGYRRVPGDVLGKLVRM